ncbi:MAG: DNA-binding protein [Deltaproteobacteria bacterium]|uniref:helix-turn-helix domain-containing protein n=1 Tax=Hydrosulfovibrio ferrireducens TaxID=2934181 RepID=UPI00122958FF|nr:MAG: DNA-binding protein [Deltaproteobacteria bacterium]
MTEEKMKKMYSLKEVAELTQTKPQTWRVWVMRGKSPILYVKMGKIIRFPATEVERLLAGRPATRRVGRPSKEELAAREREKRFEFEEANNDAA